MKQIDSLVLPAELVTKSGHKVTVGYERHDMRGQYVGYIQVAGNPKTTSCIFAKDGKDLSFGGEHDITPESMETLRMTGVGLLEAMDQGRVAFHV